MNKKVKIHKIVLTDYLIFTMLLLTIAFAAIGIYIKYFGEVINNSDLLFFSLALLSLICFIARYLYINNVLKSGIEVIGVIQGVWFYKDRGRIKFYYVYEGVEYVCGIAIMKAKTTKSYQVNDTVNLVLNKNNYKKALIKDLFF